jgi:hypothetical protein
MGLVIARTPKTTCAIRVTRGRRYNRMKPIRTAITLLVLVTIAGNAQKPTVDHSCDMSLQGAWKEGLLRLQVDPKHDVVMLANQVQSIVMYLACRDGVKLSNPTK